MPRRALHRPAALVLLVTLASATVTTSQDGVDRSFGSIERSLRPDDGPLSGQTIRYRVLAPYDLEDDERLPVVLFLHGAGERGDDNLAQLRHFPERFAREDYRGRFRGIVIAPQCPRDRRWVEVDWSTDEPQAAPAEPSPWLDVALRALDATLAEMPCDPERVYLTGLSMGGFGAWHLATLAPDRFTAVVPVCGGGDPQRADRLTGTPVWAWHGARDHVVAPVHTRAMVDAVRRSGGIVHYTELPHATHDAWSAAYALEGGVLDWLWRRRRDQRYLGFSLVCDQESDRVLLVDNDPDRPLERPSRWTWSGLHDEDPGIRAPERAWFADPTDALAADLGTRLWTCSAAGGVARVRLADRKVTFHAFADGRPVAIVPLADGSAVVACQRSGMLRRYLPPADAWDPLDAPVQDLGFPRVRGVATDESGTRLFAISDQELVGLRLGPDGLTEGFRAAVDDGRFVACVADRDTILVGDARGVSWFDPEALTTTPCALFETSEPLSPTAVPGLHAAAALAERSPFVTWLAGEDASALWMLEGVYRATGEMRCRSWQIPTAGLRIAAARAWR